MFPASQPALLEYKCGKCICSFIPKIVNSIHYPSKSKVIITKGKLLSYDSDESTVVAKCVWVMA
jgi:hypothetical protein